MHQFSDILLRDYTAQANILVGTDSRPIQTQRKHTGISSIVGIRPTKENSRTQFYSPSLTFSFGQPFGLEKEEITLTIFDCQTTSLQFANIISHSENQPIYLIWKQTVIDT